MLRRLALLPLLFAAGCASDEYVNGGNVISSDVTYSSNGLTIVVERVDHDFLPGLPDESYYRWIATNGSGWAMCVRVDFAEIVGDGGYNHSAIHYLEPWSDRTLVAWVQNAYGEPMGVRGVRSAVWQPEAGDCAGNAPP